jgi:sugar transferase (PEP-CTERM system associated)
MLVLLRHRLTKRTLGTLLCELGAINLALWVVFQLWALKWVGHETGPLSPLFALAVTAVTQFAFWSCGLYSRKVVYSGLRVFQNLAIAIAIAGLLLFPVLYAFLSFSTRPGFDSTLVFFGQLLGLFAALTVLERSAVLKLFDDTAYLGNILVLGTSAATRVLLAEARRQHGRTLKVVGILGESEDEVGHEIEGFRVIGTLSKLAKVKTDWEVKTLIIAIPFDHPELPLDLLLEYKLEGLNVLDASSLYEAISQKILLEKLDPIAVLFPGGYSMTRVRWLVKEVLEKLFAVFLLVLFAVPLVLAYVLVRLSSPGPAIYTQARVGKGGRVFTLYKFRTMVVDAEKDTGAVWATNQDSRVTWIGAILRRTRFDELPQLFNVLRGEMAFVGPRPERPEFVVSLRREIPYYHHRHFVKPGLTGWAQVAFRYAASYEDTREKLRYDLYYVKNMSLFFDVMIVLATARAVVAGDKSR